MQAAIIKRGIEAHRGGACHRWRVLPATPPPLFRPLNPLASRASFSGETAVFQADVFPSCQGRHLSQRGQEGLGADRQGASGGENGGGCDRHLGDAGVDGYPSAIRHFSIERLRFSASSTAPLNSGLLSHCSPLLESTVLHTTRSEDDE